MNDSPETRPSLLLRLRSTENHRDWDEFVHLYTPLIYGYCRNRNLQDADAADVAQEVMRAVARRMPDFEYQPDKGAFRSWLFTVTRSKLNNYFANYQRQPQGTGRTTVHQIIEARPGADPEAEWDREYQRRLFEWACDKVRDEFEAATWQGFWRTAVEGKAGADVAAALGLSVGAVYVAKSRVLARLRIAIESVDGESRETWATEAASAAPRPPKP
jgi:RNA polymerase sigma-70 factor (ECF subfamily)